MKRRRSLLFLSSHSFRRAVYATVGIDLLSDIGNQPYRWAVHINLRAMGFPAFGEFVNVLSKTLSREVLRPFQRARLSAT